MASKTPQAGTPVATGIASGGLGTGTAVDDETTLMAIPDVPESPEQPEAAATALVVAPAAAERPSTSRRDPYRPIGIALAAILVALAGLVALSSGGDTPAQVGAPPDATESPGSVVAGEEEQGEGDEDDGGNGGNNGNGNGRGNGNGNNGRGND
jgi:transcription termination factor Rho